MIQFILVVFGLVLFVDQLFVKWAWYDKVSLWAKYERKNDFIKDMVECPFCCRTHIAVVITILAGLITGFDNYMIVVPFVVSGLMTFKK
jgi:hypothetical protein